MVDNQGGKVVLPALTKTANMAKQPQKRKAMNQDDHLKKRVTTNEIKLELAQTTAAKLFSNESHATANISLLACLQKLSTAT